MLSQDIFSTIYLILWIIMLMMLIAISIIT